MTADFTAERNAMVDCQVRPQDVTSLAIQDAMRSVPREQLLPAGKVFAAYADAEVEYAPGRFLLRPRDVAKLLQSLHPRAGERALAIAAPYAAAVLEEMGLDVTRLDGDDLTAVSGAWPLIVCEGAVAEVPSGWIAAIASEGRLGVIERQGAAGRAMVYLRADTGAVGSRAAFDCAPPYLGGFEPKPRFVF